MTSTPLAASTSSALAQAGCGQRVRVDAEEQRAVDALCACGSRQIAWLIASTCASLKLRVERRAAMARGAERDALRRHGGIGHAGVVRA